MQTAQVAYTVLEVFADFLVALEGYLFLVLGLVVYYYGCDGEFVIVVVDYDRIGDVLVEWNDL